MTEAQRKAEQTAEIDAFLAQHPQPEFVDAIITDCNGIARGKRLPGDALPRLYDKGLYLPASTLVLDIWGNEVEATGLVAASGDADQKCMPVAGSLRPVPWSRRPGAQVLLQMVTSSDEPWEADPRNILARVTEQLRARGHHPVVATEIEFRLLAEELGSDGTPVTPPRPLANGPAQLYGLDDIDLRADLFAEIETACRAQGLPADTLIAEQSDGQFELNLLHVGDPLLAADQAILLKRTIKAVARHHGLVASFMAKPFGTESGNGQHVHVSLVDEQGNNQFTAGGQPTALLQHAVGGLIATMAETTALYAPHANSYRRFQPNSHMPLTATWGYDNRMTAVRVPLASPAATRVEHRVAGADANPYLVLAGILAGIDHGIAERITPPAETVGDREPEGTVRLPNTWEYGLDAFRDSPFIADYIGSEYRRLFTVCKEQEQTEFRRQVPHAEYATYLGSI